MEKVALSVQLTLFPVLNCIRQHLQRHHMVSIRQHSFLYCYTKNSRIAL